MRDENPHFHVALKNILAAKSGEHLEACALQLKHPRQVPMLRPVLPSACVPPGRVSVECWGLSFGLWSAVTFSVSPSLKVLSKTGPPCWHASPPSLLRLALSTCPHSSDYVSVPDVSGSPHEMLSSMGTAALPAVFSAAPAGPEMGPAHRWHSTNTERMQGASVEKGQK